MTPNTSYRARKNFVSFNENDVPQRFHVGEVYLVSANREVIKADTGEVLGTFKNHVSSNPDWYFDKVGAMAYNRPEVSQYDYIRELVRGNDGMDFRALYDIALGEGFGPYGKPIPTSGFTRCLTEVVAKGPFEMRKDGEPLPGLGHNARNCTFHKKVVKKQADGWAA